MALNKTYGDLKKDVQDWLNRTDPDTINKIPSFIALAEQEFSRMVKLPLNVGSFTLTAAHDYEIFRVPEDMLSPLTVRVTRSGDIFGKMYNQIGEHGMFQKLHTWTPDTKTDEAYFCKWIDLFLFYPPLNAGDSVSISYHKDLEVMEVDTDTSPALKYGYDLMLYWALKHASIFFRDPEQEQYWTGKAQEALVTMTSTFNEMEWGGSPLVILNA